MAKVRQRAGGRSEDVRRRVAEACLSLLGEGDVRLRPSDVAERSGVARATIYRWWPTQVDLLEEALSAHTGHRLDPPDTGSWAGDLRALAAQLATFFADPTEVAQNAVMAGGQHRDYDEVVLRHYVPLFDGWRMVVDRARARGEVRPDVDVDTLLTVLVSPLLLGPLLFHRTPAPEEVDRLCDLLLAATSAR